MGNKEVKNMAIRIYGNRIFKDQTIYELLIEFLLVFSARKESKDVDEGIFKFHNDNQEMNYIVEPRMSLKRFVFYTRAKKDLKVSKDDEAYEELLKTLQSNLSNESRYDVIETFQDLFYGFSAVLKNRSWTAMSLLPLSPEMIMCEAMPNGKKRRNLYADGKQICEMESEFEFNQHNFLARNGEVYYLHLLKALKGLENREEKTEKLEKLIKSTITGNGELFSTIPNWITTTWNKHIGIDHKELMLDKKLGYIPADAYAESGILSLTELENFLSVDMHAVNKIEIFSTALALQVMRMLNERTAQYNDVDRYPMIIDMNASRANANVKKLSQESYRTMEEGFEVALSKEVMNCIEQEINLEKQEIELVKQGQKHTTSIYKKMGKELGIVIPISGAKERYTLTEGIVKYLVFSIVKPQTRMTFDQFLERLYDHYRIVIGPNQYAKIIDNSSYKSEYMYDFIENQEEFLRLLKNAGYLYDLSDATSIVMNPYEEVEL